MVRGTVDVGFRVRGICGRVSGVGACPPGGSELSGCRVDQGQGLFNRDYPEVMPAGRGPDGQYSTSARTPTLLQPQSPTQQSAKAKRPRPARTPIPELGPARFFHRPGPQLCPAHRPRPPPQGPSLASPRPCVRHSQATPRSWCTTCTRPRNSCR